MAREGEIDELVFHETGDKHKLQELRCMGQTKGGGHGRGPGRKGDKFLLPNYKAEIMAV